jgi:WD40 repeat protein
MGMSCALLLPTRPLLSPPPVVPHSGGVNAVYLSRDGATAVTISRDATARVWDVASGERAHPGHTHM